MTPAEALLLVVCAWTGFKALVNVFYAGSGGHNADLSPGDLIVYAIFRGIFAAIALGVVFAS